MPTLPISCITKSESKERAWIRRRENKTLLSKAYVSCYISLKYTWIFTHIEHKKERVFSIMKKGCDFNDKADRRSGEKGHYASSASFAIE